MDTRHSEIENKYDAENVSASDFYHWVSTFGIERDVVVGGFDTYYRSGDHVVRHRHDDSDLSTLTVKCRKNANSTADRVEIDLPLASEATVFDTAQFLKRVGFEPELTIWKLSMIYFIRDESGVDVSLVLYSVHENSKDNFPGRKFIEVEVEKSSAVSIDQALAVLSKWDKKLRDRFELAEPLNASLYEIYTNRKYRIVEETV